MREPAFFSERDMVCKEPDHPRNLSTRFKDWYEFTASKTPLSRGHFLGGTRIDLMPQQGIFGSSYDLNCSFLHHKQKIQGEKWMS